MTNQEFIDLIKRGNVAEVRKAVTESVVSLRQLEQNTDNAPSYLIAALRTRNREMVELLLQLGADPEALSYAAIDKPGTTPYGYARKFCLDEYTELMQPYLGSVPKDPCIEKERFLAYYYAD